MKIWEVGNEYERAIDDMCERLRMYEWDKRMYDACYGEMNTWRDIFGGAPYHGTPGDHLRELARELSLHKVGKK